MHERDSTDRGPRRRTADHEELTELIRATYDELRRMARRNRFVGSTADAIQAEALVNETYIRLRRRFVGKRAPAVEDRTAFLRVMALLMKTVAVDRRRRMAARRRGGKRVGSLDGRDPPDVRSSRRTAPALLLALDEALERLRRVRPDWCEVVIQRYVVGRTLDETARALSLDVAEVRARRRLALRWLRGELVGRRGGGRRRPRG